MRIGVDASVTAKWYIPETHSDEAELLFDDRVGLHAPQLIVPELGNIALKKHRCGGIDDAVVRKIAMSSLSQFIQLHAHEPLLETALLNAAKTRQSVHDWIYLSLAVSLNCKFVTADRRFFLAMRNTSFRESMLWIENIASILT
jgi:predicted nucleic acid-binding protein